MIRLLKLFLPIVPVLLCSLASKAQPIAGGDMDRAARVVLYKHFYFQDPNPTHQEEFEVCYQALGRALESDCRADSLRTELFGLLYRSAAGGVEDPIDGVRWAVRLGAVFTALAMVSDEDRYRAFLLCAGDRLDGLPDEWLRYEILVELAWLIKTLEFEGRSSCCLEDICRRIESSLAAYKSVAECPDAKFISDTESVVRYYMP